MKITRILKKQTIAILLAGFLVGATAFLLYQPAGVPKIQEYDIVRDKKAILDIFDRDWYWLVPMDREQYSLELPFQHRAPQQDILYAGRLAIKVMREGDKFIGFVGYYMKNPTLGFVNFVAVNPEFRGKGYAAQMVQYAVDDMFRRGAKKITMITRPSNIYARNVYKRLGFIETREDETFVYMERNI